MVLALTGSPPITAVALDAAVNSELSTFWFPLPGTTAAGNATAGNVGEYISSTVLVGSAVSLTTGTPANVTSISLTAGDWDVQGNVGYSAAGSTTTTLYVASISTTSATHPTIPGAGAYTQQPGSGTAGQAAVIQAGRTRINVSTTTTVYLVATANFAVSTESVYGFIGARRVR